MSQPIKSAYAKLSFAVALAALGLSIGWFWRKQGEIRHLRGERVTPVLSGSDYTETAWRSPEVRAVAWTKAPTQSQGGGWLYEVFTPPVIYYNTVARSFTVSPPQYPVQVEQPGGALFDVKLLAVKLVPYRLQLLGYFGEPGDYLAAFGSLQSPETLLARPGRRFEQLGLTLINFEVRKVIIENGPAGPVYDVAALAVLQDEQTSAEVVLDSRSRKLTDTPMAVVKISGVTGRPYELHEGETFDSSGATYRIERIQVVPPEVVVARLTPDLPMPELQVLRPAAGLADKTTKAQPLFPQLTLNFPPRANNSPLP